MNYSGATIAASGAKAWVPCPSYDMPFLLRFSRARESTSTHLIPSRLRWRVDRESVFVDACRCHHTPEKNQAGDIQPASAIRHCILGERAVSGKGQ